MTSEKTRIKIFAVHLHQVKGIYKTISGPDQFGSIFFVGDEFRILSHVGNLWIATENSDL